MANDLTIGKYSVLMSVYIKEKPEYLKTALQSIFDQTLFPDEVVLVCDGPVTSEMENVIQWAVKLHPLTMKIVRLQENTGLGHALRTALPLCRNEIIMRADSDDINLPFRAETELKVMEEGDYDIISSTISIFYETPDKIEGERALPTTHDEIIKFARFRCPFNHPSVIFKKSKALEAGNYPNMRLGAEDYDLWIRMFANGAKSCNIDKTLVLMRMDTSSYDRRRSQAFYASRIAVGKRMRETKFISLPAYWKYRFTYWCASIAPSWLDQWLYKKVLYRIRKPKKAKK